MAQDWFNALFGPYFERQGKIAQESSAFADAGAKSFREQGNPLGLGQMALGAAGWLGSPIGALVPHGIEQNSVVPEAFKPAVKGALDFTDYFMPGPNEFMAPAQAVILPAAFAARSQVQRLPEYTMARDELLNKAGSTEDIKRGTQELWNAFGWDTPSIDNVPRTEISDRGTRLNPRAVQNAMPGGVTQDYLANIWSHPELFSASPTLAQMPTRINWQPYDDRRYVTGGLYVNKTPNRRASIQLDVPINATDEDVIAALGHETTHGANFLSGITSPDVPGWSDIGHADRLASLVKNTPGYDPIAHYFRLSDENLARNTEGRYRAGTGALPLADRQTMQEYPEYFHPGIMDSNLAHTPLSVSNPVPYEEQILGYWLSDPLLGLTPRQKKGIIRK